MPVSQANRGLLRRLIERPLAVSTLAGRDISAAAVLESQDYFQWGVGPRLQRGAIVAIYVPKSAATLPPEERGRIRHLFSVARETELAPSSLGWNNLVWLDHRTTLDNPLTLEDLKAEQVTQNWPLPRTNFRAVGRLTRPLTAKESEAFWSLLLQRNPLVTERLKDNLLERKVREDIQEVEQASAQSEQRRLQKRAVADSGLHYDVALSFAGEDRHHASALAGELRKRGVRVFYDQFETAELWGKDLYLHLADVYQFKARYCVVILSSNYVDKLWTRHEWKHILARAFVDSSEYLLPVRLDDTEVPGLRPTIGYIDLRHTSINYVVELLISKLS